MRFASVLNIRNFRHQLYIGTIKNRASKNRFFLFIKFENKLTENNFEHEKINDVRKLLEKFESMQYTPIEIDKNGQLIAESIDLLKNLEKST